MAGAELSRRVETYGGQRRVCSTARRLAASRRWTALCRIRIIWRCPPQWQAGIVSVRVGTGPEVTCAHDWHTCSATAGMPSVYPARQVGETASETLGRSVGRVVMAKEEKSKAGWLDRRREGKREKQVRTGDSPERAAERSKRDGISPGENADKPNFGQYVGPLRG